MLDLFRIWFGAALRLFRTRQNLMLENLRIPGQGGRDSEVIPVSIPK